MSTSDWHISNRWFDTAPEEGWVYYTTPRFEDIHIGRYAFESFWDHVATHDREYRFFPADESFNTAVPPSTRAALRAAWEDYVAA
jgi:hypothetical protein